MFWLGIGALFAFLYGMAAKLAVGCDPDRSYTAFRTRAGAAGAISPFPLDVVIDRNGVVAFAGREYEAAAVLAVIERLTGGAADQ